MEGSCAGSSLTPAPVDRTWPTPSCPPPSLLSQMTMLTTRLCLLPAHLWWASTSPSLVLMQGPCKLEWSTPSLQMSMKDRCPWGQRTGWLVRGGEAWSDLMFSQRYSTTLNMAAVCHCSRISHLVFIFLSDHASETFFFFFPAAVGNMSVSKRSAASNQECGCAEGGLYLRPWWKDQDSHVGGCSTADR